MGVYGGVFVITATKVAHDSCLILKHYQGKGVYQGIGAFAEGRNQRCLQKKVAG